MAGQSGTIQNAVFDRSSYMAGDIAKLQVFDTLIGALSSTTLAISIKDGSGNACSKDSITNVSQAAPVSNIEIPVTANCANPSAAIILSCA